MNNEKYKGIPQAPDSLDSMEGIEVELKTLFELKEILKPNASAFGIIRYGAVEKLRKVGMNHLVEGNIMPITARCFVDCADREFLKFEEDVKLDKGKAFDYMAQTILHTLKYYAKTFMQEDINLRGKFYDAEITFVAKLEECFGIGFYSASKFWEYLGESENQARVWELRNRFYNKDDELNTWLDENLDKHIEDIIRAYTELKNETIDMNVDSQSLLLQVVDEVEKKIKQKTSQR